MNIFPIFIVTIHPSDHSAISEIVLKFLMSRKKLTEKNFNKYYKLVLLEAEFIELIAAQFLTNVKIYVKPKETPMYSGMYYRQIKSELAVFLSKHS